MNIEGLGTFYLGREYDLENKKRGEQPILYDSKDLLTHAVCVGMTGSGKTGLCVALIEEAAIDGIPSIIIDPKGDLANLLLTFPNLAPEDFAPWVNPDEAARKGIAAADYPKNQADLWKSGLEKWGQSGERIARMREAAEFAIYTPGSSAGIPVSVLKSFDPPKGPAAEDGELFRERVQVTASSILGLLGIEADPVQSREHILLSHLLTRAWQEGTSVDLAALIAQIQTPPFERVGVMEVEAFYPSKDRFALAMKLNNLLAAPGFEAWLDGVPLDIASFLYTPAGKPRVAIFSIAHLADAERMFFVSLLLNQVLGWVRQQPGTTSLRALLYMDEIFGYFPPVANPPSKLPLLTLLKQARAFGLGVVLATQNPVDIDYKGLSNAGTWFIGRLQTERDKERVLAGLEGASATAGGKFDRSRMGQILAALGSRVFLMNNVHDDVPVIFETRWVMSYLRGPLTREHIKKLMAGRRPEIAATATAPAAASAGEKLVLGTATVRYSDSKNKIDHDVEVTLLAPVSGRTNAPDWQEASDASDRALDGSPVPPNMAKAWEREFAGWLADNRSLEIFRAPRLKLSSQPGENERDFRAHVDQTLREERDREVAELRQKYASKFAAIEDRVRRAEAAVQKQAEQASQAKLSTALSIGAGLLGALLGGGRRGSIGKISTGARSAGRAYSESQDVSRAEENVEALQQRLADLQAEVEAKVQELQVEYDPAREKIETVTIRPKKTGIVVRSLVQVEE